MTSQQHQQQQDKLKQLGNTLVQKEEYEQAAKFYDRALEVDSTSEAAAAIFSNRSLCLICTKQYTEALQDAEKTISLRPTWFRGYQRAAAACEKLTNKNEEGLKHLEKCFELDEATRNDVDLNQIKENFELNIIKQKAPSMTQDELKQIGNNFAKDQKHDQAITVYTLAIEKDAFCDAAVPILSNRSMAYFKIGKYKEAYEDGGFCCGIKPDWAKGFMRRGVAAEKLENWQIALESYDEYLKLDPKDEAGVTKNRKYVKTKHDKAMQEEHERKLLIEKEDAELAAETDPQKKMASLWMSFMRADAMMDKDFLRLIRKHGFPRLDTPFDCMQMPMSKGKGLMPETIVNTKKHLKMNPNDQTFETPLGIAFQHFRPDQFTLDFIREKTLSQQVSYLDCLLDVIEEEGYVHPGGRTMDGKLWTMCSHKPDHPIRKDLIFVLFDRIEVSKKIFCKGTSPSNSDFATMVLRFIFTAKNNQTRTLFDVFSGSKPSSKAPVYDPTDLCTQDIYDCIQTCLKAGATLKNCSTPNNSCLLADAILDLRSLRVVELLLRYNADPNPVKGQRSPLSCAFEVGRPDIARVLISHGAKLAEAPTPNQYLKLCGDHPLVTEKFCPESVKFLTTAEEKIHPLLSEELIQLIFECFTNQKLSFVFTFSSSGARSTLPFNILSAAVMHGLSNLHLIEIMLRIKPSLATLPSQFATEAWAAPALTIFNPDDKPGFEEYCKTFANLLINAGFVYHRDVMYFQSRLANGQIHKVRVMKLSDYTDELLKRPGYDKFMIREMMKFFRENTPKLVK